MLHRIYARVLSALDTAVQMNRDSVHTWVRRFPPLPESHNPYFIEELNRELGRANLKSLTR